MTKAEKAKLREAIRLLKTDDGWDAAMAILLPMAELVSPAMEAIKKAKSISLLDLPRGEQNFRAEGSTDRTDSP